MITDDGGPSILQAIMAFAIVIALLAGFAWGLRYVAARGMKMPGLLARRGGRLQVVETLTLDVRHRLVIVRCDDSEHLLLMGHEGDTVVANNIGPGATRP